jgi:hypothetical protein
MIGWSTFVEGSMKVILCFSNCPRYPLADFDRVWKGGGAPETFVHQHEDVRAAAIIGWSEPGCMEKVSSLLHA